MTSIAAPGVVRRLPSWRPPAALATAVVLGVLAWQLATIVSDGWIPSVAEIASAAVDTVSQGDTWTQMAITTKRILIGFVVATVIGFVIGFAMGLNAMAEAYFRPLVVIGLAIPDPLYVIVVILVLGTAESSGLVALTLALIPFVVTIVHGSVKARESQLDEMAKVYRFGRAQYLREVLARQVTPALIAAARTSFAFSWKIVVLVEALSQPNGIGAEIYEQFRLFDASEMIALALIFIVIMRSADAIFFGSIERRLLAWSH